MKTGLSLMMNPPSSWACEVLQAAPRRAGPGTGPASENSSCQIDLMASAKTRSHATPFPKGESPRGDPDDRLPLLGHRRDHDAAISQYDVLPERRLRPGPYLRREAVDLEAEAPLRGPSVRGAPLRLSANLCSLFADW